LIVEAGVVVATDSPCPNTNDDAEARRPMENEHPVKGGMRSLQLQEIGYASGHNRVTAAFFTNDFRSQLMPATSDSLAEPVPMEE
jgi:hypothetical protein